MGFTAALDNADVANDSELLRLLPDGCAGRGIMECAHVCVSGRACIILSDETSLLLVAGLPFRRKVGYLFVFTLSLMRLAQYS